MCREACTGIGIFRSAKGAKYNGQFKDGLRTGQGTFIWKNGDIYVGDWKDDLQHGRGKLTKKNGDVFEGEFKNGLVDGNVVIHYADGFRRFKSAYITKAGGKRP